MSSSGPSPVAYPLDSSLLVRRATADVCSFTLNSDEYHGSDFGGDVGESVGAGVSSIGSGSVGAIVGTTVVSQIGTPPSISSGGRHESNSGRQMHPRPDVSHSSSVS